MRAYRLLTTTVIRHTRVQITYLNCYKTYKRTDDLLQLLYFRLLTSTVIFSITYYNCNIFDYLLQLLYFRLLTTAVIFSFTYYNCYIFDYLLQLLYFRLLTTTVIFSITYYNCYIFVYLLQLLYFRLLTTTVIFSFSRSMSIKYLVPVWPRLLLDMWSSDTVSHNYKWTQTTSNISSNKEHLFLFYQGKRILVF